MRSKCPKCGAVFEHGYSLSRALFHAGGSSFNKCPACGKSSFMSNDVTDPVSWPPPQSESKVADTEPRPEDADLAKKLAEASKPKPEDSAQSS